MFPISQIPTAISEPKLVKKEVAQPISVGYIRGQRPCAVRAPSGHPLSQLAWRPEWDDQAERQLRKIRTTRIALLAAQAAPPSMAGPCDRELFTGKRSG